MPMNIPDLMPDMTADRIAALPVDAQAQVASNIAALKVEVKRMEDTFLAGMVLAYQEQAQAQRKASGKDTGAVTLALDGYVVRADSPKKVEWDQSELRKAMDTIRGWGEDPAEYMAIVLSVPESKYNALPRVVKAIFEPARTVSHGRPSFKIEARKDVNK